MGLEGMVAKRRDSRYCSGRSREWIKVKNMEPGHRAGDAERFRLTIFFAL